MMTSAGGGKPQSFRFVPRFKMLALVAIITGCALLGAAALFEGGARIGAVAGGAAGVFLGLFYLLSPAWRIEVRVTDESLEVLSSGDRRFLLGWDQVVQVIASPSTKTCFVDGGEPGKSLLVPGDGASAPYDIADKERLYAIIVEHVPGDRIREVEVLEKADPKEISL